MLFKEIVGHIKLKNRLINTVLNNRVSHAQLLIGAQGSEKLAIAIAYSQFIACGNRQIHNSQSELIADSCGNCPSCIKYQKLAHPDLHFIFPVANTKTVKSKPKSNHFISEWREALIDSNYYISLHEWYKKIGIENKQGKIGVDDANGIIKTLGIRAYEGNYKVVIIWMVEKLYYSAAPKLLKILEEPPEKTLFLLITEDPDQILKTITSRTQFVKLQPLSDAAIENYLQHNFSFDDSKMQSLINTADGNFKNIIPILSNTEENNPYFDLFREMMLVAYGRDFAKIRAIADKLSKIGRENNKQLLIFGLRIVRLCLYQDIGNTALVKASGDELAFIQKFSKFVNRNNANEISDVLNKSLLHIGRNVNPKITLMDSLLTISSIFYNKK